MRTKYYRYKLVPELALRGEVEAAKAIKVLFSMLVLSLMTACVLPWPADKELPTISIPSAAGTTLDEFNVRGYVIAIVVCPPRHQCITMDRVDIASEPIDAADPDDLQKMRRLHSSKEIMSLPIGVYRRFNLELGKEYLFSFRKNHRVVGVSDMN